MTPESQRGPDNDAAILKRQWIGMVHRALRKELFGKGNGTDAAFFQGSDSNGEKRTCDIPEGERLLEHAYVMEKIVNTKRQTCVTLAIQIPFRNNGRQLDEYTEQWITIQSYDDPIPDHPFSGKEPTRIPPVSEASSAIRTRVREIFAGGKLTRTEVFGAIMFTLLAIQLTLHIKNSRDEQRPAEETKTVTPPRTSPQSPPRSSRAIPPNEFGLSDLPGTQGHTSFSLLPEEYRVQQNRTDPPR